MIAVAMDGSGCPTTGVFTMNQFADDLAQLLNAVKLVTRQQLSVVRWAAASRRLFAGSLSRQSHCSRPDRHDCVVRQRGLPVSGVNAQQQRAQKASRAMVEFQLTPMV